MSRRSAPSSLTDSVQAAAIAHRFYVRGHSKLDIAKDYSISRFKVARILEWARETGIVKVTFDLPFPIDPGLSGELCAAYGLRRAFVLERASQPEGRPELRRRIGALAASVLSELATKDDVIGLSWARSVNVMTEQITSLPRCAVVQLCGVQAGMDMRDRSVETVSGLARVSGGDAYPIFAPLVLPDRRTTETLRRQPGIAETFGQFRNITKAVVSIGAWQENESTVYDSLSPSERDAITKRGAKAEVAARLFDAEGNALSTGLAHHVLAISHEELHQVPEVIALGYTTPKAEAIDAVLRSGMVSTFITDADAARKALELAAARG
ncbi:sugar-binding domain-containing protein [Saccharomonospora sp. NPDC006951]